MTTLAHCRALRAPLDPSSTERKSVFVASTDHVDRYGDIVDQSWVLDHYRANPVVLSDHAYGVDSVVGRGSVALVDGALHLTVEQWSAKPAAQAVRQDVEDGILQAVSVGFRPGRSVPRASMPEDDPRHGKGGYIHYDNELLEVSVVAVPANPHAVAAKAVAQMDTPALAAAVADRLLDLLSADATRRDALAGLLAPAPSATPLDHLFPRK